MLRRRGKQFTPQLLDKMMGRQPHMALQIMIDSHELDDSAEDLAAESQDIFSGILDSQLQCMPGLLQLLKSLEKAGLRKAIATSSRRLFTQRVLGQFEPAPRFEFILTSEDVQEGKPHPEIYRTAAARFGIEPAEMMVIEDSQNGCSAPPLLPGPSPSPCPAATATRTTSAARNSSPRASPTDPAPDAAGICGD